MPAGKSRGGTPFCRTLKIVFPRSRIFCKVIFRCNCSTGTVAKYPLIALGKQGGAVLFAPPRKAVAFLTTRSVCQKHGTEVSLPAGSDQGYSPWTSPAFLKNCWSKKLLFACGSSYCNQHQNDFHSYNLYKFPHKNEKSPPKRKTVRGKPTVFLMEEIIQCNGADYEARTRYLHLGKVALYQMS